MLKSLLRLVREWGGAAVVSIALRFKYQRDTPAARSKASILVADEDPASAVAVLQALDRELPDVLVIAVATAEEASRVLSSETPPILAVVDCHMNDGDGWKIALRAPRRTAIILVSGEMREQALRRLAAGVGARYLPKPLDLGEFARLAREELEKHDNR